MTNAEKELDGPLTGITVLDLSRVLAGPWATQILADLGARVIKIERPGSGDDTRHWGPPFLDTDNELPESAYYLAANRRKEVRFLDLANPEAQDTIRTLAKEADIVVENFRVGGLTRYGLDYAALGALNPRLIYCSITGFGQDGPRAQEPGYDYMMQAMGGLMSLTGTPDKEGGAPMRAGIPIVDLMTGMYATTAIQAALWERQRTGKGRHIDMALFDVALAMLANQGQSYLLSGESPGRIGNRHPMIVPYQPFQAQDRPFIIAVGNDGQFARLCRLLGLPELSADARFATNSARVKHRTELIPLLTAPLARQPADYWLEKLAENGIPCGPILSVAEAFNDPQARHRKTVQTVPHPEKGRIPVIASPIRFCPSSGDAS